MGCLDCTAQAVIDQDTVCRIHLADNNRIVGYWTRKFYKKGNEKKMSQNQSSVKRIKRTQRQLNRKEEM